MDHSLPCPPASPRVCLNSCALSWWCYLTISLSATLFSFCPQSFPASGAFPMSWLFTSGGQSTGTSASVLPMIMQDWFPLGLNGLNSWQSKGVSRVFFSTTTRKQCTILFHNNTILHGKKKTLLLSSCLQEPALLIWKKVTFIFAPTPEFMNSGFKVIKDNHIGRWS